MTRPYLLDTNIVSKLMREEGAVVRRLAATPRRLVAISVISELELRFGLEKKGSPPRLTEQFTDVTQKIAIAPLPADIAKHYAPLRVELERRGTPISAHDLIIAAQAIATGAVLVTNNTREFERVKGLRVEDWSR